MGYLRQLGEDIGNAFAEPMRVKVAAKKQKEQEDALKSFADTMGKKYGEDVKQSILSGQGYQGLLSERNEAKRIGLAYSEFKLKKDQIKKLEDDTKKFAELAGQKYGEDYKTAIETGNFDIFSKVKSSEDQAKKNQAISELLRSQGDTFGAQATEIGLTPDQISKLRQNKSRTSWQDITPDMAQDQMMTLYKNAGDMIGEGLDNMGDSNKMNVNTQKLELIQELASIKANKLAELSNNEEFSNVLSFYQDSIASFKPDQLKLLDSDFLNSLRTEMGDKMQEFEDAIQTGTEKSTSMAGGIPDLKGLQNNMVASSLMSAAKEGMTLEQIKETSKKKMDAYLSTMNNMSAKEIYNDLLQPYSNGKINLSPEDANIFYGIYKMKVFKDKYVPASESGSE